MWEYVSVSPGAQLAQTPASQIICSCLLQPQSSSGCHSHPKVGILGCHGVGRSVLLINTDTLLCPALLLTDCLHLIWGQEFQSHWDPVIHLPAWDSSHKFHTPRLFCQGMKHPADTGAPWKQVPGTSPPVPRLRQMDVPASA